ncbi:MAG TPA: phosphopantetheine-binding protein [Kofleriaceae bacterium]|nr:phosphopantetheine-binding protein [Kofleriaceae bacterium]
MTTPSLQQEIKELIVESLQLEGVDPATISDTDALFGSGLNLDSIDALELATAIARKFDIKVSPDQDTRDAFRSVNHLAAFITAQRAT